jgi:hypothetical protein
MGTSTETHNSFSAGMNLSLGAGDFESALETVLMAGKRQADGGLPQIGFMRPKTDADQVDKGVDVGLPFGRTAPDLGAFELMEVQTIQFDSIPPVPKGASSLEVPALASSGLPLTFSTSDTNVVSIVNRYIMFRNPGMAIITASQPGSAYFYPAIPVSREVVVYDANALKTPNSNTQSFFFIQKGRGLQLTKEGFETARSINASLYDSQGRLCLSVKLQPTSLLLKMPSLDLFFSVQGNVPNFFLKATVKCWGFLYPMSSATSATVFSL